MIQLLAVSVGKPQEIDMQGKKVLTSMIKTPLDGPVFIHSKGPEGDQPAVHPGAVYAISSEHYDYWAKELNRDKKEWSFGHFGENLTLQGIEETQIRIGDRFKIGNSVELQVISCRIPCSKLAWRMGQSDEFLRLFQASGKTGFYLDVLKEGHIQAGDSIEHIQADKEAMTLADLSHFIVTLDQATEEQLHHALSHEHLGIPGRNKFMKKLVMLKDLGRIKEGRWTGWREFILDNVIDESNDVKSFILKPTDGKGIGGYRAGQFLTCKIPHVRTWTISDYDPTQEHYRISIKKAGDASSLMHQMEKGATLLAKAPNGSFALDRSTEKPVILISAGIGITPMIAMLKAHLERDLKPYPCLYFVHATQNSATHSFQNEVKEAIHGKENVKILNYYSNPLPGDSYDVKGRFKIADLDALMEGNKFHFGNKWHDWPKQEGLFYICGPASFQDGVQKALEEWGVKEERIFTESFSPLSGEPLGVKAESSHVTFSKSGIVAEWSEKEDLTLLELAEKFGIAAPYACRMGACETCECLLQKGAVFYEHGALGKRRENSVLTCSAKPGSSELTIEL